MSDHRVVRPYGQRLSDAQARALANAARGRGRIYWIGGKGDGVPARWNVCQALEALSLTRLVTADGRGGSYQWELTEAGHERGLALPLPADAAA